MKYFLILLLLACTNSYAQNYTAKIAAHRENYEQDFLKDAHSPLKQADLQNLHFFEADSTYRVLASAQLLQDQQPFEMVTSAGTKAAYIRFALIKFTLHGQPQQLTIYKSMALSANPQYKDHLFLPFKDQTNGNESYGAGRYIDLNSNDIKNNAIEIDFNKAYNPYCAYSAGYQCPMPPAENDLKTNIKAGEMQYGGDKKH